MIELVLLKALSNKQAFFKFKSLINPKILSVQSLLLLKDYTAYFDSSFYANHPNIDWNTFSTFFFTIRHPYLDEKSILEYKEILNLLEKTKINEEIQDIYFNFEKQELYHETTKLLAEHKDIDVILTKFNEFKQRNINNSISTEEDMDLNMSLKDTDRSKGLKWRCSALKDTFTVIKGDFGLVAGFPGAGKSSFIASEISYMAEQLLSDEKIYWLSNEGDKSALIPRLYCATLNCLEKDLRLFTDKAITKYIKIMNGDKNRIIIKNIQGWTAKDIENLVLEKKPKLVVIDLLDNVNGFDKYITEESSFEKYHKLYQWGRELATKTCPILAVSQFSVRAENTPYPQLSDLRGSKIDKQAALSFAIFIGKVSGQENIRYISMPKEKMGIGDLQAEVKFDGLRCRYD